MKMKLAIGVLLIVTSFYAKAQSLPAEVIGASGDTFGKSAGSLEWTLGEIMVETYARPVGYLTQGFHQPTKVTITNNEDNNEEHLVVYPNPVAEILNIRISEPGTFTIELFNLQGQKLIHASNSYLAGDVVQMNVSEMKSAMYLLRVANVSSGKNILQKIEKQ